ncbi:MAG: exodeoxyribonuclease VII small subunit [Bacteroidota bacterium]|nr:exodeoxyribonuclease VII small subunit [Bacteroidota bacterium]
MAPKKMSYEEALEEIKKISLAIQENEIPIDDLGDKVKYAKELLAYCQSKLKSLEETLEINPTSKKD